MIHYLIDTENMGKDWKWLLQSNSENQEEHKEQNPNTQHNPHQFHIFYTDKSPAISLEMVEYMVRQNDTIEFIKCYQGPNALDFQLVTLLGYLNATSAEDQYYIVTKDTGYDAVVNFWVNRGKQVQRISKEEQEEIGFNDHLTLDFPLEMQLDEVINSIVKEEDVQEVKDIILKYAKSNIPNYKSLIHGELVKKYRLNTGRIVYYTCKSIAEQIHTSTQVAQ